MTLPSCSKNGAPLKEDPAAANCQSGSPIIRADGGLHLSGADEKGPRDAVVVTVDCTKILWLLRLNGEPEGGLCAAAHKPPCGVPV